MTSCWYLAIFTKLGGGRAGVTLLRAELLKNRIHPFVKVRFHRKLTAASVLYGMDRYGSSKSRGLGYFGDREMGAI